MELEYRFPDLPEWKDLRIIVNNDNGRLSALIRGKYSLRAYLLIKTYFIFNDKIGSLATYQGANVPSLYLTPMPSKAHNRMFSTFLSSILLKRPLPMAATIGITTQCQCTCLYCSAKGRSKKQSILSTEELKEVSRQCIELGITNITFTGGEPLLRLDLEEIISSISPDQAIVLIFTNALELTAQRTKLLKKAGLFGVHISLDSADPSEHDYLRGVNGSFNSVQKGVQNALEAGLLVGISTYVTIEKALNHSILSIADLCEQWGVHEISVFDGIQTGNWKDE